MNMIYLHKALFFLNSNLKIDSVTNLKNSEFERKH